MANTEKLSREEIAIAEKVKFWAEQAEYNERFVKHIKIHAEELKELRADAKKAKKNIEEVRKGLEENAGIGEKIETLEETEKKALSRMNDIENAVNALQGKIDAISKATEARDGTIKFLPIVAILLSAIAVVISIGS